MAKMGHLARMKQVQDLDVERCAHGSKPVPWEPRLKKGVAHWIDVGGGDVRSVQQIVQSAVDAQKQRIE